MESVPSLASDYTYVVQLLRAGLEGIGSARHEPAGGGAVLPERLVWKPAALGATVGMLGAHMLGNRKSAGRVAWGCLVGSACGFGAAKAWGVAGPAARSAIRRVSAVRDARWLEAHPIDYA